MDAMEGRAVAALIEREAEPLPEVEVEGFARFIDRHAGARVICLGESTHGTDEFHRARAAITERLVAEHGFEVEAVEADWPDAGRIDAHIRGREDMAQPISPFRRFPAWMWRNRPVRALVDRLRGIDEGRGGGRPWARPPLAALVHGRGDRLHGPPRARGPRRGARALWLPRALGRRSRDLRPARPDARGQFLR